MSHFTKYGKRMRLMLLTAMFAASMVCLFAIPFVEKNLLNNQVAYYRIEVNGTEVGAANSRADAAKALADARGRLSGIYPDVVYMEPEYTVIKESHLTAERMSEEELSDSVYSALFSSITDVNSQIAYTVRMDDATVTLASLDDVYTLLSRVEQQYDTQKEYTVQLNATGSSGDYTVSFEKTQTDASKDIVSAVLSGQASTTQEDGTVVHDGITSIDFAQNVTVSEVLLAKTGIVNVDTAYEAVTKSSENRVLYEVKAGETVESVASDYRIDKEQIYEWNTQLDTDSVLAEGEMITLSVPETLLSVVMTKRETYDEAYRATPRYIQDEEAQKGKNTIEEEGSTGTRKVTAEVSYINGRRTDTKIIDEKVQTESQPQVISVGTQSDSAYGLPVSGQFGGNVNNGVIWLAKERTSVYAAAEGTVTRTGWYADYGYCIDITHKDGSVTRYGHLDAIGVVKGQNVTAGQLIANSGSTGNCDEPCLYFELWINGNTVNPLRFIQ